jgi:hypothetical protein
MVGSKAVGHSAPPEEDTGPLPQTLTRAQFLRYLTAYRAKVAAVAPAELEDPTLQQARIAALLEDFGAFCQYYFPHIVTVPLAPFHVAMATQLAADPNAIVVCQWARGLSKTTTARMAVLWLMCRGQLHFALLASSSQLKARRLLAELQVELAHNRRLQQDFGLRAAPGQWSRADFALQDGAAFRAYGKRQNPRGEQHRGQRPDFIWLDDIDDDAECRNPHRLEESFRWIMESLYMAGTAGRTRLLALNNVIAPQSLIVRLAAVPDAQCQRVNILDAQGQSVWPQKYDLPTIRRMLDRLGYRSSQQEFFNNPAVGGQLFRPEHIRWVALPDGVPEAVVGYLDPSWSDTGDYKAMVLMARQAGVYYVLATFCRQCSQAEAIGWAYATHLQWRHLHPRWYLEGTLLQDRLMDGFRAHGQQLGWQLPISPDRRHKPNKQMRIASMSVWFERGELCWLPHLQTDTDTRTLLDQLFLFGPSSRAHDDGPDALEGALACLQHSKTPARPLVRNRPKGEI